MSQNNVNATLISYMGTFFEGLFFVPLCAIIGTKKQKIALKLYLDTFTMMLWDITLRNLKRLFHSMTRASVHHE